MCNEFQSIVNQSQSLRRTAFGDYSMHSELDILAANKQQAQETAESVDEVTRDLDDEDVEDTDTSFLDATISILTTAASCTSQVLQAMNNSGGGKSSGTTTTTGGATAPSDDASSSLDSAVSAFSTKPKDSQRQAVVDGIKTAQESVSGIDAEIAGLQTQNAQLSNATPNYEGVLTKITDGLKQADADETKAQGIINDNNKYLSILDNKSKANQTAQADTQQGIIDASALETAKEATITTKDGQKVEVTQQKAGQFKELQNREADVPQIAAKISRANQNATHARRLESAANTAVRDAEKAIQQEKANPTGDADTNGKKKVDDSKISTYNQRITEQKQKAKEQKEIAEQAEKDEKKYRKEEEENNKAIEKLKGQIKIADKTIADLESEIKTAEGELADAKQRKENYTTQLKGYIDEAKVIETNTTTTEANNESVDAKLVDLCKESDAVEQLKTLINPEEAKKAADQQIETNSAKIRDLQAQKAKLEASINNANSALATNPIKGDTNTYKPGQKVYIDGQQYTVDSTGKDGVRVKNGQGTYNVDFTNGKPVISKPSSSKYSSNSSR